MPHRTSTLLPTRLGAVLGASALIAAVACPAAGRAASVDPVIHFTSTHGRFAIPESLFLGGEHPEENGTDATALLSLKWPDLTGAPQGSPIGMQVLLAPLADNQSADAFLRRRLQVLAASPGPDGQSYDPGHLRYEAITPDGSNEPTGPGIKRVSNAHPLQGYFWSEVFVETPDRPGVLIACIPLDRTELAPSCIEQFVVSGLKVQATYPRGLVGHWKAIQSGITRLVSRIYRSNDP